jgi:hypothetical protein
MGGGLMQLVAYGAQDVYLTGNPQITFFKVVYRRHTNFSMELIQQTLNGNPGPSSRVTSTISRNGDLVGRMYVRIAANSVLALGLNPGHNMFDSIEVEIGGQLIDRHPGHFMEVHASLTEKNQGTVASTAVQAAPPQSATKFQSMALAGGVISGATGTAAGNGNQQTAFIARTLTNNHFVPLRFWFNRNPGLALPLIALQYHEVKLILNFSANTATSAAGGGNPGVTAANNAAANSTLWAEYIYLDTDERRRFAQVSHEYLIEQVQTSLVAQTGATGGDMDLNFNHPVKELIWAGVGVAWGGNTNTSGTVINVSAAANWQLKLNGHDRFAAQDTNYFTKTQVYEHHTGCGGRAQSGQLPTAAGVANGAVAVVRDNSIAVYSFALKPEEHQPSGTCNFSRIDSAILNCSAVTAVGGLYIYAINYNVLRIMSGMGGLAYSN